MRKGIAMSKLKLAILGVIVATGTAAAQKPKYTRQTDVKVDVKLTDRTKPIQTQAPDPKDQRPTLSADDVLSIEGLVGNIRNEQEALLAKLIDDTPDTAIDERSKYYFILSERYA